MTHPDVVISDVNVIDVETGLVHSAMDIEIAGSSITAVEPTRPDRSGTRIVPGTGMFCIPGLWDSHVHHLSVHAPRITAPLFLANGVTSVRDMSSDMLIDEAIAADFPVDDYPALSFLQRWQREAEAGEGDGPRIVQLSSFVVDGPGTLEGWGDALPAYYGCATADDAVKLIEHVRGRGADFVKVYSHLLPEGFEGLLREGREVGMPVLGHKPLAVPVMHAVRSGMASIEHLRELVRDCYPGADELRSTLPKHVPLPTEVRRAIVDEHDAAFTHDLLQTMAELGTRLTPTLGCRRMEAHAHDLAYRSDPRLRYFREAQRLESLEDADSFLESDPTAEGIAARQAFYELELQVAGEAQAAGVEVLAGTDANDSFLVPGFSLHDELQDLVRAGLSPRDALACATLRPARFMGLERRSARVEPGFDADLLLLSADPLTDIAHVREIDTVIRAGRVYDRAALDDLLWKVEREIARLDAAPNLSPQA